MEDSDTVVDISRLNFDPNVTFNSGQTFRWKRFDASVSSAWEGVISGHLVSIDKQKATLVASFDNKSAGDLDFKETIERYLSAKDDLELIFESFPKDDYLTEAFRRFMGLRILTQEPWECLISFVCSINKNIPAIKLMIESLSRRFGRKIRIAGDRSVFSFPEPAFLAKANKADLLECGLGFRWRYVKFISKQIASGRFDLESMAGASYSEAIKRLVSETSGGITFGVGHKVADCTLLFAFHKTEAFPIDVWILRCLRTIYSKRFGLEEILKDDHASLTPRSYELAHERLRDYFGEYCGYAQQYLYMKVRSERPIQSKALA